MCFIFIFYYTHMYIFWLKTNMKTNIDETLLHNLKYALKTTEIK